jgi:hypothetical protein
MSGVMWQIGEFLLDVCVKLFCNDRACPLNPYKNTSSSFDTYVKNLNHVTLIATIIELT